MHGQTDCDLLITNGYVITMDAQRSIFAPGAVAIAGQRIIAVGPEREIAAGHRAARVIDAQGAPVHPGFVEAHYHATLHMTRGVISDDPRRPAMARGGADGPAPYSRWFNAITDEDEHANALAACTEMLRNGYTCFMEAGTTLEPDTVAAAAEAVGMRALLADPFLWDHEGIDASASHVRRAPASLERCLNTLGSQLKRNRDPDALVRGYVFIYGCGTASDDLTRAAKACAQSNGVVMAQHQSFLPEDAHGDVVRFGRNPVVHLAELGILDSRTTLVHLNVIQEDECKALEQMGAAVVWHPGNYVFWGLGEKRIPQRKAELHHRGVPIAFGTDIAKAWTFGDLPFIAYLVTREVGDFLPTPVALEMATIGGARAAGLADEIGSLEPGKRADVVIRRNDIPEAQPGVDPILEFLLVSRGKSVDIVVVDGEIVVRQGRLVRVDEAVVLAEAQASARRLAILADL